MPSFVQIQFGLLGALLAVLVGVGLVQWARSRPWRRESRSDIWQMAICFLIALAARLAATPFPADNMLASTQGVSLHTRTRGPPLIARCCTACSWFSPRTWPRWPA